MSTPSESGSEKIELDLDLQLLPAWAQKPPEQNKYAKYEGEDETRPSRRGFRPDRERRDQRRERPPFRKDRPDAANRTELRSPQPRGRPQREERRDRPAPKIEVNISFVPEEKGVESLARQIRLTGRAYPLFDIATLILRKPDRYQVRFGVMKTEDGKIVQPLFVCGLDDTLWLSEQDAVDHVLAKHFALFYQAERVATEPPKGTYTFVAQCGISGTILGPPNYHDYQNKLRRLHGERFAHMPFDVFKSRIKIVRDEATVKKWVEEQSWRTEYVCLNVPEPAKLPSREEVEKHFREAHLPNVIKPVESHELTGLAAQSLPERALQSSVRRALEDQLRFPLRVVNVLSQQFAGHGLQFFKVNKTVTHVAVARPHYLDLEATPVSETIKRIVAFIDATSNCTRRKLLEALAPGTPIQPGSNKEDSAPSATAAPSPEAAAIVSDLHWLIHQGHVIEFSNGLLETAKKPAPRPPKPEPSIAPAAETAIPAPPPGQAESSESAPVEPNVAGEASTGGLAVSEPSGAGASDAVPPEPPGQTVPAAQSTPAVPAEPIQPESA
ncbi:MAG: hypothetical protein HY735_19185 [Verrucomicrobia bacterium]|nr:hypothetical protein [Verrucomicrobiota bacterium]